MQPPEAGTRSPMGSILGTVRVGAIAIAAVGIVTLLVRPHGNS